MVDVESTLRELNITIRSRSGNQAYALCPFHEDTNPSLSINMSSGLWKCHSGACDQSGSLDKMRRMINGDSNPRDQLSYTPRYPHHVVSGKSVPYKPAPQDDGLREKDIDPIAESIIVSWEQKLQASPEVVEYLHSRGITDDSIVRFRLGFDGTRLVIPVKNSMGHIIAARRYSQATISGRAKMLNYSDGVEGRGKCRTFNVEALMSAEVGKKIVYCEGEFDTIIAAQNGYLACTGTAGAGSFDERNAHLVAGKTIYIVLDNDTAGRRGASKLAAIFTQLGATAAVVSWPEWFVNKGDITDWFVHQDKSVAEFEELLKNAIVHKPQMPEEDVKWMNPSRSDLVAALRPEYMNKPVCLTAVVSGKMDAPYIAPAIVEAKCGMDYEDNCTGCPMAKHGGHKEFRIVDNDRILVELIRISDVQQFARIHAMVGAPKGCPSLDIKVQDYAVIDTLRLIPSMDAGDGEYMSRDAFCLQPGVLTNQTYELTGTPISEPQRQNGTFIFRKARAIEDSISSFRMTPDIYESLKKFQGTNVEENMMRIALELEHVHHIYGRPDMCIAMDLVWHSALSFHFAGNHVKRGWAELYIIGDPGQGKTEMFNRLRDYYRAGELVQAEQSSLAGLVGGLQSSGSGRMFLVWGKIPLNDRKLIGIDEYTGFRKEDTDALSSVRSSGVAEITKIHSHRTHARVRKIFMSNTMEGRSLATFGFGCQALLSIFSKIEDIRRFDFAMAVSSGDVNRDIINKRAEQKNPSFTSDDAHNLIMWAWSRNEENIFFSQECEDYIFAEAKRMSNIYSTNIPLCEPADHRYRIARLAVSTAIRTFATDDGESVRVEKAHAEFVVNFLETIYSSSAFSFKAYSTMNTVDEDSLAVLRQRLVLLPRHRELSVYLMQTEQVTKSGLEDRFGDKEEAKNILKFMMENGMLRSKSRGYYKTPLCIAALKEILNG